jgi:urease accessory protein
MTRIRLLAALSLIGVLAATPAFAHTGHGLAGGFTTGFMHPVGGLDHLLAMAAVGIWGAFLGRPLIWLLPVAFPLVMVVGAIVGIAQVPVPFVEIGIAASVVVLGAVIAGAWRAPAAIAVTLIALFALCHGYAHGLELPQASEPSAYAAGFVVATGLIHLAGIAFGLLLQWPGGVYALRASGAAIAVAGLWITAGVLGLA